MSQTAYAAAAVTPNDSADLPTGECRALYVGVAGNVALRCAKDGATTVTFVGVPAGTVLPVRTARVMSTNTTASSIVALY